MDLHVCLDHCARIFKIPKQAYAKTNVFTVSATPDNFNEVVRRTHAKFCDRNAFVQPRETNTLTCSKPTLAFAPKSKAWVCVCARGTAHGLSKFQKQAYDNTNFVTASPTSSNSNEVVRRTHATFCNRNAFAKPSETKMLTCSKTHNGFCTRK